MWYLLKLSYRINVHHSASSGLLVPVLLTHPSIFFNNHLLCILSFHLSFYVSPSHLPSPSPSPPLPGLSLSFISPLPRCRKTEARSPLSVNYHNRWRLCCCVSHPAALCCTSARMFLLTQGKGISTSWSRACSERLRSLPGSGAWGSPLCIRAANFNLHHVTVACTEKKQARPLAASPAIVFPSGVWVLLQCRLSLPGRAVL